MAAPLTYKQDLINPTANVIIGSKINIVLNDTVVGPQDATSHISGCALTAIGADESTAIDNVSCVIANGANKAYVQPIYYLWDTTGLTAQAYTLTFTITRGDGTIELVRKTITLVA